MAIYDHDENHSQVLKSIDMLVGQPSKVLLNSQTKLRELIDGGEYERALDLLRDRPSEASMLSAKAVLLMRTGKPGSAANLLRSFVWDLTTFTLKPDVPSQIQLNFATAILMTGNVSGCLEIIRSINVSENEQAIALLEAIRSWEKSLSLWKWLDWKVCGIEHLKGEFPISIQPGCFGWEPKAIPLSEGMCSTYSFGPQHHDLAC